MVKKEGSEAKPKQLTKVELEQALINNFINLQKVLTNLSIKFDELSGNISKLLQLFEISAKSFAEKNMDEGTKSSETDKDFLKKLDSLLDQNKVIAKGIMLMEDKIRNRTGAPSESSIETQEPRFRGMIASRPLLRE
jgi:hypothetical protein